MARDGEEAVGWLDRWQAGERLPMLILLDLALPCVDGLEVLRACRADARARHVPVVVLTTSAEDADVQAAYACGVNSYLLKPVDFDDFLQLAARVQQYRVSDKRLPTS